MDGDDRKVLEALQRFFGALAPPTQAAFVVIQHLSPDHRSMMPELLARHTSLPVREAVAGESLEVDHIYLMPAGVLMTIEREHLVFTPRPLRGVSLPIDLFFRSLAGASAALLTLYDLTKPVEPALAIGGVRLLFKEGGKSGIWIHPDGMDEGERRHYRPRVAPRLDAVPMGSGNLYLVQAGTQLVRRTPRSIGPENPHASASSLLIPVLAATSSEIWLMVDSALEYCPVSLSDTPSPKRMSCPANCDNCNARWAKLDKEL